MDPNPKPSQYFLLDLDADKIAHYGLLGDCMAVFEEGRTTRNLMIVTGANCKRRSYVPKEAPAPKKEKTSGKSKTTAGKGRS